MTWIIFFTSQKLDSGDGGRTIEHAGTLCELVGYEHTLYK